MPDGEHLNAGPGCLRMAIMIFILCVAVTGAVCTCHILAKTAT